MGRTLISPVGAPVGGPTLRLLGRAVCLVVTPRRSLEDRPAVSRRRYLLSQSDKRRLTISPAMAYGKKGVKGAIPGNATLIFDVELVNVQ